MKYALVTGANRGLGAGVVEDLVVRGYTVYACMRSTVGYSSLSPQVIPVILDITDDNSIIELKEQLENKGIHLDLLVNNAATNAATATNNQRHLVSKLDDIDRALLLEMFDMNSISPLMVIKQLHGLMGKDGIIVNISSDRASFHDEFPNSSANYGYRASKIALNMMTFCSTYDLEPTTRIVCVHPGDVRSNMNPTGNTVPTTAAATIYNNIIAGWKPKYQGAFVRFNGEMYPL